MDEPIGIIWGTRSLTWRQMNQLSMNVARQLNGIEIKKGDHVALCDDVRPEYLIVLLALFRMGVVVCPVNPRLPQEVLCDYLHQINANVVFTAFALKSHFKKYQGRVLLMNEFVSFDARQGFYQEEQQWEPDNSQIATIIATSGSSGYFKAVVHTLGNHISSAKGSNEYITLTKTDRWLLSLPFFHVSGLGIFFRCFLAQATIVLPQGDMAEDIIKRRVTHVSLVATQLYRLLNDAKGIDALKSLKVILLGGSAIPTSLLEKSLSLGLNIYVSYGLTEMASQVATGRAGQGVKVLNYRKLKVRDGEILVGGETLFKGYWQAKRINAPFIKEDNDCWFMTGDLGKLDISGNLSVLGRKDNMFISGGENIYPEEIERVLLSLEQVEAAVIVPQENAEFGQQAVAFVKFKNAVINDQVLIDHCRKFLPGFKVPKKFLPWPQNIPDSFKVRRELFSKFI